MPSTHTVAAAAAVVLLSVGGAVANRRPDGIRSAALGNATSGLAQQRFRSSDIVAPVLQVTSWDKSQTDDSSYIFIGASLHGRARAAAPMILSGKDLSLVYADQQYGEVHASSVQTLNGSKYLTFWEAAASASASAGRRAADGHWLMFDSKYELKYNLTARGSRDLRGDVPDMRVTRDDTVLLATYETVSFDCSPVGGPADAPLLDSGFQEIDPATNEVLFEWRAREHFNLSDSLATFDADFGVGSPAGFDFFHLTSVEKSEDGNYLVSSSHLSALAMVDGRDGHVLWTLGGKHSDFTDAHGGNATAFAWQHDAQLVGSDEVVLFDNHARSSTEPAPGSRGLRLRLNMERKTVELVKEFRRSGSATSGSGSGNGGGGSVQLLKEGHAMVAWGSDGGPAAAAFVEYNKAGQPVMDVQLGSDDGGSGSITAHDATYRVSRHRWQGEPTWPPSVAVDAPFGTTAGATVYVSWNGATDVAHWAILAADTPDTVSHYKNVIARANRTGFETSIPLDDDDDDEHQQGGVARRYIGAAALSAAGDVMGASFVYDMRTGRAVMQSSGITTVNPPGKATAAAGAMGGSIFGVSMVFYIVNYFWRRKAGGSSTAQAAADHGAYEKVSSAV